MSLSETPHLCIYLAHNLTSCPKRQANVEVRLGEACSVVISCQETQNGSLFRHFYTQQLPSHLERQNGKFYIHLLITPSAFL